VDQVPKARAHHWQGVTGRQLRRPYCRTSRSFVGVLVDGDLAIGSAAKRCHFSAISSNRLRWFSFAAVWASSTHSCAYFRHSADVLMAIPLEDQEQVPGHFFDSKNAGPKSWFPLDSIPKLKFPVNIFQKGPLWKSKGGPVGVKWGQYPKSRTAGPIPNWTHSARSPLRLVCIRASCWTNERGRQLWRPSPLQPHLR
jgi:hypothetical protein